MCPKKELPAANKEVKHYVQKKLQCHEVYTQSISMAGAEVYNQIYKIIFHVMVYKVNSRKTFIATRG